jgi:cation diffusion facilitator family transporter
MSSDRNPSPAAPAGSHNHEPHHRHGGQGHNRDDHHGEHSTRRAAIAHAFSELTGAHSHDAADSVDKALESSERGIRALKISFLGLMVTAAVQAGLVLVTGSVALLADTIHNFSDALTAIPLFVAFKLGRRAANRRYTYGYRRAEDLAGLFIVLMILASAVLAAWESIERLVNPREVRFIGVVFLAGVVGFLGNELVAIYRIRVGRAIGSAALVADGKHARVDGLTSLAVAAGAAGMWLGFDRADPVVGILVSLAILAVLRTATRDIYRRLMDAVDPELVAEIEKVACSIAGVARVGRCQVRWMGHWLRVDMELAVDGSLSVAAGHQIAEEVRHSLLESIAHLDEVHVHVDPALDHPDRDGKGPSVNRVDPTAGATLEYPSGSACEGASL